MRPLVFFLITILFSCSSVNSVDNNESPVDESEQLLVVAEPSSDDPSGQKEPEDEESEQPPEFSGEPGDFNVSSGDAMESDLINPEEKLYQAVLDEDLSTIDEILHTTALSPDVCFDNTSALIASIEHNKFKSFEKLLEFQVSLNEKECDPEDETPFFKAVRLGRLNFVSEMLKIQPDLLNLRNKLGDDLSVVAGRAKQSNLLKYLIENFSINTASCRLQTCLEVFKLNRSEELNKAIYSGNIYIVQQMIGDDLKMSSPESFKAFIVAVKTGNVEIVALFIENGIDVNRRSEKSFKTALHYAALLKHPDVVELLIGHGAEVDVTDMFQYTPTMIATLSGDLKIIKILLDADSRIDMTNFKGQTALMMASFDANVDALELLLKKCSADVVNAKDENGNSALTLAAKYGETTKYTWQREQATKALVALTGKGADTGDCQKFVVCQRALSFLK